MIFTHWFSFQIKLLFLFFYVTFISIVVWGQTIFKVYYSFHCNYERKSILVCWPWTGK